MTTSASKYTLTDETKVDEYTGRTLHRIKATRDIPRYAVKAGDLGGWIETKENLAQDGDCWIAGNARVWGNASVWGNARVWGNASVGGNARVGGNAHVGDNASVGGNARV